MTDSHIRSIHGEAGPTPSSEYVLQAREAIRQVQDGKVVITLGDANTLGTQFGTPRW